MAATHAERMDAIYRSQRHIYDLTRKYYLLGRDRLIAGLDVPVGGSVLEIGCGTGRNLAAVAKAWPGARLYGIDISAAMLETAAAKVSGAGLAQRVRLGQGDATAFEGEALFCQAKFDRIFISYSLSMIPNWQGALDEAAAKLAPGGSLHVVDFGQQERLPAWWRRLLFAWLKRFDVFPRGGLDLALRDSAAKAGGFAAFRPLYRGYAWMGLIRVPD